MPANVNQFRPFRVGVNTRLRPVTRAMGRLAGPSTNQEIQAGSAVAGAAAGAAYGSVVPGIGTAVGAVVGLIASALIHQGQGALRSAQAQAIDQGLSQISSANHQGQAIPWQGSAQAPGLNQFLSALMTSGLWMGWDTSVTNSPSVNGNWVTTFVNAVKAVVKAICTNPTGAALSVPIVLNTGAKGIATQNFTFTNPGISVGPDVIASSIIMGQGGLMYWMIKAIGETDAHASANANNAAAQKVFALMVDHAAYDYTPPPAAAPAPPPVATPTPAPPPAAAALTLPANAPPSVATGQPIAAAPPVIANTNSGSPVVAPGDEAALIQALMAQGASQNQAILAAMASMQATGQNPQTPAAQQYLQAAAAPSGISSTTLLIGGGILAAVLLFSRG